MSPDRQEAEEAVKTLLHYIESVSQSHSLRDGIAETPKRVVNSFDELFSGYFDDVEKHCKLFDAGLHAGGIVLVKDIEFNSTCEHHMLPFVGKAHVAYIPAPGGKVLGVSKLARMLHVYCKRLQIQERIGEQLADALYTKVPGCKGSAVIIDSKHLCMSCRGVNKQHSSMVTSALRGVFLEEPAARAELMSMIS